MPRLFQGCLGILSVKRSDAETDGRLGVSLSSGYLLP